MRRFPGEPLDPSGFAEIEHVGNGFIIHYREAAKQRVKRPSPLQGLDTSWVAMLVEIIAAQTGGDDWDEGKKEDRKRKMAEAIQTAKLPTEDRFEMVWILQPKTIFCPTTQEIPKALEKVHEAFVGIQSLRKEGESFSGYGPVLGMT